MDFTTLCTSLAAGAIGGSGLSLVLVGFLKDRWIEKVRAGYATALESVRSTLVAEQKHIQASIDRSIFVTRTQFDTEFNAMKDIFRYATMTRLALEPMRPMFQYVPEGQSTEEKSQELRLRLENLIKAFNEFSLQLEILSPFYPHDLYVCLTRCRVAAATECTQVRHGENPLSPKGYLDADKNISEFAAAYQEAATVIRERLKKVVSCHLSVRSSPSQTPRSARS